MKSPTATWLNVDTNWKKIIRTWVTKFYQYESKEARQKKLSWKDQWSCPRSLLKHYYKLFHIRHKALDQAWATSGPRATSGPQSTLMWPASFNLSILNSYFLEDMLKIQKKIIYLKNNLKIIFLLCFWYLF